MKKPMFALIAYILFTISAGAIETSPLISLISIVGMATTIKVGKLYKA